MIGCGGLAAAAGGASLAERLAVVRQEMDGAQAARVIPATSSAVEVASIIEAALAANDIEIARDALASVGWGERLNVAAKSPEMVNAATAAVASNVSSLRKLGLSILVRSEVPLGEQVFVAARAALDDSDASVVNDSLRILRNPNATIDPAQLERFLLDPSPDMEALYQDTADSIWKDREWTIRESAMRLRITHGTLATDLDVYPTLSDIGQRAATTALYHVILTPPANPVFADQAAVNKCAAFLIDQLKLPTEDWNTEDPQEMEYLGGISLALACLASYAAQGVADPTVLDILDAGLTARRDAILAQPGGDGDPRLAGIALVLDTVTRARDVLNPPPPPGSG